MQQDIRTNLERVRERIARAAERSGRRTEDVLLVGVSKTVEVARIRAALAAGLTALGENRVQEARGKVAELGRPVAWHLVGHLQTNKVRDALELFDVVHSVDRIDLARELDRRARARGRPVDALVQVHVGLGAATGVRGAPALRAAPARGAPGGERMARESDCWRTGGGAPGWRGGAAGGGGGGGAIAAPPTTIDERQGQEGRLRRRGQHGR